MDLNSYYDIIYELDRIVNNEYNAADSERDHQAFAAALKYIIKYIEMKI